MNSGKEIPGILFSGETASGTAARLSFSSYGLSLETETDQVKFSLSDAKVSPKVANAARYIFLPGWGKFLCPNIAELDSLPQVSDDFFLNWLESRVELAIAAIVLFAAALLLGYYKGLPAIALHAANKVPIKQQMEFGQEAVKYLEKTHYLTPSKLPEETTNEIRASFQKLLEDSPKLPYYRLEFRHSAAFGANAFAFPGGIIVLTDDMVRLADKQQELSAILAHEIGHVEQKHAIRKIIQGSAASIAITLFSGDIMLLNFTGLLTVMLQTSYSRNFETEADTFAFNLLARKDISPMHFANIMTKLHKQRGDQGKPAHFLSSHPLDEERIKRAQQASLENL